MSRIYKNMEYFSSEIAILTQMPVKRGKGRWRIPNGGRLGKDAKDGTALVWLDC